MIGSESITVNRLHARVGRPAKELSEMVAYLMRRLLYMVVSLVLISVIAFVIIQLPPGDFVDYLRTRSMGYEAAPLTEDLIAQLRSYYGLDQSVVMQYFTWAGRALQGNLGMAFLWNRPVSQMIGERLPLTIWVAVLTLLITYLVAIPVGVYTATHQYSIGDYAASAFGFVGMAVPSFLFALILLVLVFNIFGVNATGLFSPDMDKAPWSLAKVVDMLSHLVIPLIVIGTAGTAGIIRVMRGVLLDELSRQYVIVARAKGVPEKTLIFKYPVRSALNPIVSTIGWQLPANISGTTVAAVVLNLPTLGPTLLDALQSQDMYLAGAVIMLLSFLVIAGTLVSDLLLMVLDPRIRT
jgi:peptide/nickel transport system permease protein